MRLIELSLRNYRVFEEVDLELPARVIGIFGQNGAGKSTLVEAVQYGMFGRARTDKSQIRTHGILTDCAVRLLFEHGGQQYEVRRTIKGRNHQTEAELYAGDRQLAAGVTEVDAAIQRLVRMDVHLFRASVFAEQKQLDAFSEVTRAKRKEMVLRLLGIQPLDRAREASRRGSRETKRTADRLAETLPDLRLQEAAAREARSRAGEAEEGAAAAAAALGGAEERVEGAREAFSGSDRLREHVEKLAIERRQVEERADQADARRGELTERIGTIEAALEALATLEREQEALRGATERLAAARKLAEIAEDVARVEAEISGLPEADVVEALAELREAEDQRRTAERSATRAETGHERAGEELAGAEEALARASDADPAQPCPTCGRPLGDDFEEYLRHCRQRLGRAKVGTREAAARLKESTAGLLAARKRFDDAAARGEEARKAGEARAALERQRAVLRERLRSATEPFGGEVPDVEVLAEDARRAEDVGQCLAELRSERRRLDEARAELDHATAAVERFGARLQEIDRQLAALAFDPEEHARLEKELHEADRLLVQARNDERDAAAAAARSREEVARLEGLLAQARETAARVGELRDEARYVERVAVLLDGFRDHLVARIGPELSREAESLFRDLSNREYDDLRIDDETLAIQIADGERYFPVERFSGSEADLANLALRVAISIHLSRMSGADLGLMVLDEVLASLDAERKDLFVQTMGRLARRFHQLFVITHAEQVKDQFPASIEVRKVGRRRSEAFLV